MDSDGPTYAEMEEFLDKYAAHSDVSSFNMDTQGMLVQMYEILKKLMADVQQMQDTIDDLDISAFRRSEY
jgi:hypothetical protein